MLDKKPNTTSPHRYTAGSPFDIIERKKPGTLRQIYLKKNPDVGNRSSFRGIGTRSPSQEPQTAPTSPAPVADVESCRDSLKSLLLKAGLTELDLSTIDFSSFNLRSQLLSYTEKGRKRELMLDTSITRKFVHFSEACLRGGISTDADKPVFPELVRLRGEAFKAPPRLRASPYRIPPAATSAPGDLGEKGSSGSEVAQHATPVSLEVVPSQRIDVAVSPEPLPSQESSGREVQAALERASDEPEVSNGEAEAEKPPAAPAESGVTGQDPAIEEKEVAAQAVTAHEILWPEREEVSAQDLDSAVGGVSQIRMAQLFPLSTSFVERVALFSSGLDDVRTRFSATCSAKSRAPEVASELQPRLARLSRSFRTIADWFEDSTADGTLEDAGGDAGLSRKWQQTRAAMRLSIATIQVARLMNLEERLSSPIAVSEADRLKRFFSALEQELFSLSSYLLESARRSSGNI